MDFWFQGEPNLFRRDPWFTKNEDFDAQCRTRFAVTAEAALDGTLDPWADTPAGTLALLIALDQFPRNIHRGTYMAFAGDAHARRIARGAVAGGVDARLTPVQRVFLYLPFEHSEDLADQDLSVRLFEQLDGEAQLAGCIDYAHRHRDVVRRFGRFPHRNAALGRASTAEEEAYLAEPGSGF
nr:DUF924 family protein [Limobrevibacterium gyesilva]